MSLNGTSGNIHSPGFRPTGGQYGAYQRCTYDVTVPGGVPVTVRFDSMKVHESDEIVVSEAASDHFRVLITPPPIFRAIIKVLQHAFTSTLHKSLSLQLSLSSSLSSFTRSYIVDIVSSLFTFSVHLIKPMPISLNRVLGNCSRLNEYFSFFE